jgi:hypothetical protein
MSPNRPIRPVLTQLAWAYVLIYLNINLGPVDILPNFVGWFLLADGVHKLGEELPSLPLLRPLALGLGVWELADWLLPLEGQLFYIPLLIVRLVRVYFNFQLFHDLAGLAARVQPTGRHLDRSMKRLRNAQVVLETLLSLPILYPVLLEYQAVTWLVLAAALVLMVWTLYCLFALRNLFPVDGSGDTAAPADAP